MTTAAQRERTQLRTKLYTGCMIPGSHGRGGARIPESSRDAARPGLVQLWPTYLDKERAAAKPTLTLVGVKAMLEEEQTPAFKAFAPRRLSGGEVAVIRAWYEKAQQQEKEDLGDAVAAAQGNIMGQAAANHDEVMEKLRGHDEILQRLDNHTKSGSQLQREATKRKQEELRDEYQAVLRSVGWALPEEPLQPLAEYRNRLRDPVLRTALAEKAAAAKARKEEPAAAAKLRRQATAAPRKRGADADDTGASVGTPSKRRRSVDKSMPGGEPPEGVTAAHGARGSQLPESAAESALARLPRTGRTESAAESALAPAADLEHLEGKLLARDLSAEAVRERLLRFPKEARLPLWHAVFGEKFVRLPEAPTNGQVLIYNPRERSHYYVREGAVQRSSETDPLTTAMARIHFAALVSRGQPKERRAARAMLLRDYHPDKTGGAAKWAAAMNYIQASFAEEW